jgi:hypothetical protein
MTKNFWCRGQDLNLRPPNYISGAPPSGRKIIYSVIKSYTKTTEIGNLSFIPFLSYHGTLKEQKLAERI